MAITTVARCKAFRGIAADNTEHDAELARLIPAAQAFLERVCGRQFDRASLTEEYDGSTWRDRVIVARPPIASITALYDDPQRQFTTPLAGSTYFIADAEAGIVRLFQGTFSLGIRNIRIEYTGGYAMVPQDLEQAAIELVWAAREKGAHNLVGVRSRSVADGSVQWINLDWGSAALDAIIARYAIRTGVG